MQRLTLLVCCALLLPLAGLRADEKLAEAFATSGMKLLNEGKAEKAREMFLRALGYDEACGVALYELGKMFEGEGNAVAASDFLSRAVTELGRDEKAKPEYAMKRQDAERRLQKLNVHAGALKSYMDEYATELGRIYKKNPDSLTAEEAHNRMRELALSNYVSKLPDIPPPAPKQKSRGKEKLEMPPDVERVLKTSGWTSFTGVWKKKAEKVFEVTDGKLEAAKVNGAVQVFIHAGSTGSVKVMVRNSYKEYEGMYSYYGSGYGVIIKGSNCKVFTPYSWGFSTAKYEPYMEREVNLPDANPKNYVMVQVMDTKLEITVNGKKEKVANYQISKDGPFIIEVTGTATIESPAAVGQ